MLASLWATGQKTACKGLSAALFALLLVTSGIAQAESNPIVFQSTDTPPFWSASLPENGLGGAILHLLSNNAGIHYSIEYLPVKRFRHSLATYIVGDPDMLMNQEHRAIFPIGIFHSAFFYYKPRHDAIEFHSIKDLRGHTLGVLRGTIENRDYFLGNGIKVEESDSIESLLKKLKRGRIDFCILVAGTGQHMIQQIFPEEPDNFAQKIIPESVRPLAVIIDVAVPEGKAVARRYRQVLEKTLRSREYHEIMARLYGKVSAADRSAQLNNFIRYYANTWDE